MHIPAYNWKLWFLMWRTWFIDDWLQIKPKNGNVDIRLTENMQTEIYAKREKEKLRMESHNRVEEICSTQLKGITFLWLMSQKNREAEINVIIFQMVKNFPKLINSIKPHI